MNIYASNSAISISPKKIFQIGNFWVTETMISGFITVVILLLFALIVRVAFISRWEKQDNKKSAFRLLLEYLVSTFNGSAQSQTGRNSGFVGAFYFSAAAFICIGTLVEMLGLRPPTSDLNLTLTFGLFTFLLIFILGFKEKKARRLLHYCNPINIISDVVIPFSLALRMFGSVFSGYMIMHLIYSLPPFALIALPAIGNIMFTIFHALIQSYIFMFLSMCFIGEATE